MPSSHVAVTGATNGIGLAIARRLASEGLRVTLVGRDEARLSAARKALGAERVSTARADYAVLDDVRRLAAELPDVDIVVSNAATVAPLDATTVDGHQRTLQVNHLAPYLLLRLLTERRRAPSRVVIVGADPALLSRTPVDLDHLDAPPPSDGQSDVAPFALYGRTKNMDAMTMVELARRTDRTLVCGAHPGIIGGTDLVKEAPGVADAVERRYGFDRSTLPGPEVGADTPAWLATTAGATHGAFYVDRSPAALADHVTDPARCALLWQHSARLVDLPPE